MSLSDQKSGDTYFTISQAAQYLKVSTRTLQRFIKEGRLRVSRVTTRRIIIHKKWLDAYAIYGRSRLTPTEWRELHAFIDGKED